MAIAPNLTVLVGELVGARLIAHAGMSPSNKSCVLTLLVSESGFWPVVLWWIHLGSTVWYCLKRLYFTNSEPWSESNILLFLFLVIKAHIENVFVLMGNYKLDIDYTREHVHIVCG